jgi:hypothetical protein
MRAAAKLSEGKTFSKWQQQICAKEKGSHKNSGEASEGNIFS